MVEMGRNAVFANEKVNSGKVNSGVEGPEILWPPKDRGKWLPKQRRRTAKSAKLLLPKIIGRRLAVRGVGGGSFTVGNLDKVEVFLGGGKRKEERGKRGEGGGWKGVAAGYHVAGVDRIS
jgi:hypothetical protein